MTDVVLDHVTVHRDGNTVIDDVSFAAPSGSLTVVVGASGAGKTSLLRTLAGLDQPAAGAIVFGDVDVTGLAPRDRNTSFTFQEPALMPTRSVARNIALPLEVRRETADQIAERVGVEARVLHIDHLLRRGVDHLSIGEAQMVQIARSLVYMPQVLLLDEPFAAIEGQRAAILRQEVRHLQREFGVTTLLATNDPSDVAAVADQVVVLEQGRLTQVGPFDEVFEHPLTATSAVMTGDAAIERVSVEGGSDGAWLVHPAFRVRAWAPSVMRHAGRQLLMVTRPEWWKVTPHPGDVEGTVKSSLQWAGATTSTIDASGHRIVVRGASGATGDVGERVRLKLTKWTLLDPLDGFAIR